MRKNAHKENFHILYLMEVHNVTNPSREIVYAELLLDIQQMKERILQKYNPVFRSELAEGLPLERLIDHEIFVHQDAKPPHRALFHLSPLELMVTKEYVTDLLRKGKIRPRRSLYVAQLFFVKPNWSLRDVIDCRPLNIIIKWNNNPIPKTDEMIYHLAKAEIYTKLDLKLGFHQIKLKKSDVEKSAFKTKYGPYFIVILMGIWNALATFQALINSIFHDLIKFFMLVYLDDLLIYRNLYEEHINHVEVSSSWLRENDLYVGQSKFENMTEKTEFLGIQLGVDGRSVATIVLLNIGRSTKNV